MLRESICSLAFNDVFTLNFISFSFSVVGNIVTLLPPVIAPSVVVMLSGFVIFIPFPSHDRVFQYFR